MMSATQTTTVPVSPPAGNPVPFQPPRVPLSTAAAEAYTVEETISNDGGTGAQNMVAISVEALAQLQKQAGRKAREADRIFPPQASKAGFRFYAIKYAGAKTDTGGVYCGWKFAEQSFASGLNWNNIVEQGCLRGFATLEEATGKYYEWYPKRNTVTVKR